MHLEVDDGASVFLVTSGPAAPLALNGKIVSHDGDTLVIRVEEPVELDEPRNEPIADLRDRRESQRYPTWLDATVVSPSFANGQAAVVTDLSVIGAAVEVDQWTGDVFFRLEFDVYDQVLQMECETIHQESTWRGTLVHTRFVLMTDEQHETLEAFVAALRSVFGEAQEHLATDRLAPAMR